MTKRISIRDCEKRRTPRELREWVDGKNRALSATRRQRDRMRRRKVRHAKWFMEEIFPLSRFASIRFGSDPDVRLRPLKGGRPYDAEISGTRGLSYRRIEITHASETYEESLRMELLEQTDHTPMTGPIAASVDSSGRRVIDATLEAVSSVENRQKLLDEILRRVDSKAKKSYAPDVALLVAFSPLQPPSEDDRVEIERFAATYIRPYSANFPAIYLVSTNGEYVCVVFE